jgi:hypothetical protein
VREEAGRRVGIIDDERECLGVRRGIVPRRMRSGGGSFGSARLRKERAIGTEIEEVSTMRFATTSRMFLCSVVLGTALGCSNQPTAPSQAAGMAGVTAGTAGPQASPARFGDRTPGVVYVTSQGLYYDTFVVKDPLPMEGKFQLLVNGQTEFGPGQPGYLGGRWWEDLNGNGVQDADDHFFLCPLLPPGRPTPAP